MKLFQLNTRYIISQWDVLDMAFSCANNLPIDVFSVEFGAVFRGPQGATLHIPGFYNGDNTYVLRFSAPALGIWNFETYAGVPELAGLTGTVDATVPASDQHGPIEIDTANPQRFVYADGSPYFLLAFECDWLFALDLATPDDFTKTQRLINRIAEYDFNHVVMNVYAHDVEWDKDPSVKPEHEFGSPATFPFGGNNFEPDFSVLNVDFFKHLDHVICALNKRGIVAHLMIYVWNKCVNWPDMYSDEDNRYFDYVIARYQAFTNIVWDISKEALTHGRCDMDYITERISRVRRQDAYERLLTVHDYGYCSQFPQNVDFISIQTWTSGLYHAMRNVRDTYADKPVFNIEHGGYEEGPYTVFPGNYVNAEICLERNYECIFAGAYSTYYWQDTSWNVVIPDPMELPEAERPKFVYYRHLLELFKRYDFNTVAPAPGCSSSGYRLTGPDLNLYLLPKENFAMHTTVLHEETGNVRVTWFNPFTGEYVPRDEIVLQAWHEFKSPWSGQMTVLIIETRCPAVPDG